MARQNKIVANLASSYASPPQKTVSSRITEEEPVVPRQPVGTTKTASKLSEAKFDGSALGNVRSFINNRLETRAQIIESFVLLVGATGRPSISLRELGERTQIPKSTLKDHFDEPAFLLDLLNELGKNVKQAKKTERKKLFKDSWTLVAGMIDQVSMRMERKIREALAGDGLSDRRWSGRPYLDRWDDVDASSEDFSDSTEAKIGQSGNISQDSTV